MSVATIVLDNEPAQALVDAAHRKHARIVTILTEVNRRTRRRPGNVTVILPTAVRVEAGWDRADAAAANANRIARARDRTLDAAAADRAVRLRTAVDVSVVDACVGEAAESATRPAVIVTSDVTDMVRLTSVVEGGGIRVVAF